MIEAITLKEYLVLAKKELDNFERFWEANAQNNPDIYLGKLLPGDWDEQLAIFTACEFGAAPE